MQRQVTFICIKARFGSNLSEERFTSSEYLLKDNHPLTIWQVETHQEARGVVQEAAEAAHEVPLQEGRVLWRKMFGAVGEQRGAAVCFHLCKRSESSQCANILH